jgi:conjugative relaxase-like TrwC/TraI family protein
MSRGTSPGRCPVLRVRTIYASTAAAAAVYYAGEDRGYAGYVDPKETQERPGRWTGAQAADLGLDGPVATADLEALLSGRDPKTGTTLGAPFVDRLTKHGTIIRAVAGYDATFSAPKSVSVWWGLTGDRSVLDAHNTAVSAVLAHLERYGCTTRVRVNGTRSFPDANGLTMAVFQQSTSREDDPQLHTHAVVSSKVQAPNGRWYALDGHYLKNHQHALGNLYQSVLRAELTHRYGVEWGPIVDGQAEISGIPEELLETFSKRTLQVEDREAVLLDAFREREGRDPNRREAAAIEREAAADSRPAKSELPLDQARARWLAEAAELGWTPERLASRITREHTRDQPTPTVDDILDTITAERSTWRRADVIGAIAAATPAQSRFDGATWARALEHATDQVLDTHVDLDPATTGATRASDGRSIWIDPDLPHLSHYRVLAQEERILTWAIAAQDPEPAPSVTVDATGLDPLQADTARAVAGHDPLVLVVGPAGTGKTTMLGAAGTDLARHHRPAFGVAPTAKAARVLEAETGIPADTIAKLLYEWDRPGGPGPAHCLPSGTTLVVDESSMVGTNTLDRLVGLAQSQQWRLVLVGDPRQLQAVGRGGMFDELCRTGNPHHLQHVHRFAHRWEADVTLALRSGHASALDAYFSHHRVTAGDIDDLIDRIAHAWVDDHEREHTVAVTAETNAHVDALNTAIQARRRHLGHLDADRAVAIGGGETAGPGDLVVTRRNDRTVRTTGGEPVRNRERWRIESIQTDGSLTLSQDRGHDRVTLPADYARRHLRLGYAATAHGHQGDTVDCSYTLVTPATSHRALYVGATRGRDSNRLLVVTEESDLDVARDTLERVLSNDRADIPAVARRRDLAERGRAAPQSALDPLEEAERAVIRAVAAARPFETEVAERRDVLSSASAELRALEAQHRDAGPLGKRRLRVPLADAADAVAEAREAYDLGVEAAARTQRALADAVRQRDRLQAARATQRVIERLDALQHEPPSRSGPELGLGL